ncbi:MAG TPA: TIGR01212 family radical SAM protein, partial [Erysipelotrichaceae bacterium]|nr:TIGR01212 family radical SAM protein [Erysipelotrichaceae bacterium]
MNNPYPYSNDNKRYQTINYYFRNKYHQKVAKIPLNA